MRKDLVRSPEKSRKKEKPGSETHGAGFRSSPAGPETRQHFQVAQYHCPFIVPSDRVTGVLMWTGGFAGASALGGAATSFEMLIFARAGQGVFGALLAPAALALLTTTFTDAKERAKAFGVYGAIAGAGGAIGLLLGGLLTEYFDWRWTLYVNLVVAVVAFIGGAFLLKRTIRDKTATLDIPGALLVGGGLFSLVYGFSNAESHDRSPPQTWGWLVAGAVLLAAFTWWQTRSTHPLLPLRVLLDRNRGASFVSVLISGAGMFGVFLFLTYYLQQSLGYTPSRPASPSCP